MVFETWSCYVAHIGLRSSCISLPVTRTTEVNHRLRKSIAVLIEMCCSLLSVAVLQHSEQMELREERVSFSSHCPVTVYHRGKSGQGPEAGTEAETMAKCCLWACSSGLGSDQHCPQWAGSSHVSQQPRQFLIDMNKAKLIGAIAQLRQLFPGKCCLCQLDKTLTTTVTSRCYSVTLPLRNTNQHSH